MKKWKKMLAAVLTMAMIFTLSSCGGGGNEGTTESAGSNELVIAIQDEIEGTDIQQIGWENIVQALLYEPLVRYNTTMEEVVPAFAEKFEESEDGLTMTFTLPEDAKFCNGAVCDAEAVKASFERYIELSEYSTDFAPIESIETPDERTVVFKLSAPAPFMMANLTSTYGGLVDAAAASEMEKDAFNRKAIGNGPYAVEEWVQGSHITLIKNEYYKTNFADVENKGVLAFDKITIRFIPDEFTRVSELESGGVDIIYNVPAASVADLSSNEDVTLYNYEQAGVTFLNMQTGKGALADPAVREAMIYAINRDEIVKALDDMITPVYSFVNEAQICYSEDFAKEAEEKYAFDPDKSKQILKDAGYKDSDGDGILEKDGKKLTIELLTSSNRSTTKNSAPIIQKQLMNVGIDAQIREYESSYIKQMHRDDDYDVTFSNYEWTDPDMLLSLFTPSSGYPWSNDEVTALLEEARMEPDTEKRTDLYVQAQQKVIDEKKAFPLFSDNQYIATKSNVKGFIVTMDGRSYLNDTVKE